MKKSTKIVVGLVGLVGAYELWTRRAAAGAAATAAFEHATGTAPPPPSSSASDMAGPPHHTRGAQRPGRGGGGGGPQIFIGGDPTDYGDAYADAMKLARDLRLMQGARR